MVLNELRILSVNFGKIRVLNFLYKYSNVTNVISIFNNILSFTFIRYLLTYILKLTTKKNNRIRLI